MKATDILDYLQHHPDFFVQHSDFLHHHLYGSRVTALQNYRIKHLEQRNETLQRKVGEVHAFIKDTTETTQQFMQLHSDLLAQTNLSDLEEVLRTFAKGKMLDMCLKVQWLENQPQIEEVAYQEFVESHFKQKSVYLGRISQSQREQLLLNQNEAALNQWDDFASFALVNLPQQGMLIFVSSNKERFKPEMDTLYLEHLSEILTCILKNFYLEQCLRKKNKA